MVNSNGVIIAPTNFAAANGLGTNSGTGGVSTNLASAKIYIGNILSNATPQTVSGDATLGTNGALTLKSTGTAGTYAQTTFDANGRETSGVTTLPLTAGGTGQTSASAALTALGGASLTANNTLSGSNTLNGAVFLNKIYVNNGLAATEVIFPKTIGAGGDATVDFTGPGTSSGNGISEDLVLTNVDTSMGTNIWGQPLQDTISLVTVGNGAPYADCPGTILLVNDNSAPKVFGRSNGGNGNVISLWSMALDPTYGSHTGFPYINAMQSTGNSGTNNRPYGENLKNNSTNTVLIPADNSPLLVDLDQGNGISTFNYSFVFGGTNTFITAPNGAYQLMACYTTTGSANTNGYWDAHGPSGGYGLQTGGDVAVWYGGTRLFFMENGITPTFAETGVLNLGASGQVWNQVWCNTLEISTTNTAPGSTTPVKWTTVNVGGTAYKVGLCL